MTWIAKPVEALVVAAGMVAGAGVGMAIRAFPGDRWEPPQLWIAGVTGAGVGVLLATLVLFVASEAASRWADRVPDGGYHGREIEDLDDLRQTIGGR